LANYSPAGAGERGRRGEYLARRYGSQGGKAVDEQTKPNESGLIVLWTSGDRDVALGMVLMYTLNSRLRGWWDDVTLIVWGASAKLLAEDGELQDKVGQLIAAGGDVVACIACANMFGVTEKLQSLGIEVKSMGLPLTQMLKADKKILTF
jgi:hypothetical protein